MAVNGRQVHWTAPSAVQGRRICLLIQEPLHHLPVPTTGGFVTCGGAHGQKSWRQCGSVRQSGGLGSPKNLGGTKIGWKYVERLIRQVFRTTGNHPHLAATTCDATAWCRNHEASTEISGSPLGPCALQQWPQMALLWGLGLERSLDDQFRKGIMADTLEEIQNDLNVTSGFDTWWVGL